MSPSSAAAHSGQGVARVERQPVQNNRGPRHRVKEHRTCSSQGCLTVQCVETGPGCVQVVAMDSARIENYCPPRLGSRAIKRATHCGRRDDQKALVNLVWQDAKLPIIATTIAELKWVMMQFQRTSAEAL